MATKIQQRRDTAANWASVNPVLAQGELGYITDSTDFKIGDGTTAWNSLAPWSSTIKPSSGLLVIADNGYGTGLYNATASTVGTSELMYTVGIAATDITVLWEHWYTSAGTVHADTDPSGPISFNASIRIVSSSNPNTVVDTIYRITFGGRTTATLDPGGQIVADPVGISVAPGDVIAIRTYLASGTAYCGRATYGVANWGGFTAASDLTAPGSAAIASSTGNYYGPAAVLGRPTAIKKSVFLVGDSIQFGVGDGYFGSLAGRTPTTAWFSQGGFAMRALSASAGVLSVAQAADYATWFIGTNGSFRRLSNARFCTSAIIEYGVNDLILGSVSATQLEAANLAIAATIRAAGINKVFLTTITPKTSSTDGWATVGNQTVAAPSIEPRRVAYNAWVRAGCPIDPTSLAPVTVGTSGALLAGSFRHPITGFFDTASKVESSLNSGLWLPCQRVITGSISASSTTLTSSTASFNSARQEAGGDLGATAMIIGAGAGGANSQVFISAVGSSTSATVTTAASTAITNGQINMGVMTIDGLHPSTEGHYRMSQVIDAALL